MRAVQVGGPLGAYFPAAKFDTPFGYEEFDGQGGLFLASIQQWPMWPGTGHPSENRPGNIANAVTPPGACFTPTTRGIAASARLTLPTVRRALIAGGLIDGGGDE